MRILMLFLSIIVLIPIQIIAQSTIHETEPNDSTTTANPIVIGDTILASISPVGDLDYYSFKSSKIDTILISFGLINNSQLSGNLTITGNIISEQYYNGSLFVILGLGIHYLEVNSPTTQKIISNNSANLNLVVNDSSPITSDLRNVNTVSNIESFSNRRLKIMEEKKSYTTQSSTGDYQVILKKFIPIPLFSSANDFYNIDYFRNWNVIFDERWNQVRTRVYFFPNGPNTKIQWQYGKDTSYGNIKNYTGTFNGLTEYCVVSSLSNLEPNTTYHYRVHIFNSYGDIYSNDYVFNTPNMPDINIKNIAAGSLMNYIDTSYASGAGGDFHIVLNTGIIQSISFNDNTNGWISGSHLGIWNDGIKNYSISFYYTNDGGNSWHGDKVKTIDTTSPYNNAVIRFTDKLHGFFFGTWNDFFIFSTNDGGNSWQMKNKMHLYWQSFYSGSPGNISFSDLLHGTIVGFGNIDSSNPNFNTSILHTTNGGSTWLEQSKYLTGTWNDFNDVYFSDSLRGIVIGQDNHGKIILNTIDGGNNWQKHSNSININCAFNRVFSYDSLRSVILGNDLSNDPFIEGIILRTTNGGETWIQQNTGIILKMIKQIINGGISELWQPPFEDVSFSDSLTGVIVGGRGTIVKTTDGGSTWNKIESGTNNDLNCVKIIGNKFYAAGIWGTIIAGDIVTTINEPIKSVPIQFILSQNYPNPFNPSTTINYSIPKSGIVSIIVYDVLGREISTLVNEEKRVGNYSVQFNGDNLPSGIYFYRMQAGSFTETKKLILLR